MSRLMIEEDKPNLNAAKHCFEISNDPAICLYDREIYAEDVWILLFDAAEAGEI